MMLSCSPSAYRIGYVGRRTFRILGQALSFPSQGDYASFKGAGLAPLLLPLLVVSHHYGWRYFFPCFVGSTKV